MPSVKLRDIYPSNQAGKTNHALKSTKHTTKEFIFDQDHEGHTYDVCRSNWFVEDTVDINNDEGIYLEIDKFYISRDDSYEIHPHKIQKHLEMLKGLNIDIPKIYSFKKGRENKDGDNKWDILRQSDNWTSFWTWIKQSIKDILSNDSLAQQYVDRRIAKAYLEVSNGISHTLNWNGGCSSAESPEDRTYNVSEVFNAESSLFKKWFNSFDSMMNNESKEQLDTLIYAVDTLKLDSSIYEEEKEGERSSRFGRSNSNRRLNYKASTLCGKKPTYNLDKLGSKAAKRYPMLKYIDDYNFAYQWKPEFAESFLNYINIIDVSYESTNRDNIFTSNQENN